MTEPIPPAPPAGGDPPNPSPPAPPAPAPAPIAASVSLTSDQLKERLAEERTKGERATLKALGFEKAEDAKKALENLKKLETEKLTESEKAAARIKELEPQAQRLTVVETNFAGLVEEQFKALPEATQKAIDDVAQGNAEKRLEFMRVIRASGGGPPAPAPPNGNPPAPKPPVTITPAPAPPPNNGAQTKFQEWQLLDQRSPMLGDVFYQTHSAEIERTRPATT